MKKLFVLLLTVLVTLGMVGCGNRANTNANIVINQKMYEKEKEISSQYEEISQKLDEVNVVKKENEQLKETVEQLKENNDNGNNIYQNYVDIKFPEDGNIYICTDEDITFYSDEYCSNAIKRPKFSSEKIDEGEAKNGINIYILRTTSNQIVYTTQCPSLCNQDEIED